MQFYIMYRNGIILPTLHTPNQCKGPGHPVYYYRIGLVFPNSIKLDENDFIVDHSNIDDLIKSMDLTGSCETMHQVICKGIQQFFEERNIKLVACKCILKASETSNVAYMEYIYLNSKVNAFVLSAMQM